jgi:hypothetical protein
MKERDGADELAESLFYEIMDIPDDETAISNAKFALAEKLREVARGAIDTKDWNL